MEFANEQKEGKKMVAKIKPNHSRDCWAPCEERAVLAIHDTLPYSETSSLMPLQIAEQVARRKSAGYSGRGRDVHAIPVRSFHHHRSHVVIA